MSDVITRERLVYAALKSNPGLLEPLEALAAVVWPSEVIEALTFNDVSRGCLVCDSPHYARGFCQTHYAADRRARLKEAA